MKNIKSYITEKLKIEKHLNGYDINIFEDIIKKLYYIGLFKKNYNTKDFSKMSLKIDLFSTDNINFISLDNIIELFDDNLDSLCEIENKNSIGEYRIKKIDNPNEFIILHYNRKTNDIEEITVSENIMKFIIDYCK